MDGSRIVVYRTEGPYVRFMADDEFGERSVIHGQVRLGSNSRDGSLVIRDPRETPPLNVFRLQGTKDGSVVGV